MKINKYAIIVLSIILLSFLTIKSQATVFNSIQDGDWWAYGTFDNVNQPNPWDTVNINHNITWSPNANTIWRGDINVFGTLTINANNFRYWRTKLKVDGKLIVHGKIIFSDAAVLFLNNPDTVKIDYLETGYAEAINLSRNCGGIIIDTVQTSSLSHFTGYGVYITQYEIVNSYSYSHLELGYNTFITECKFTTGIYEPKRVVKEKDFLNFDILGRKIR